MTRPKTAQSLSPWRVGFLLLGLAVLVLLLRQIGLSTLLAYGRRLGWTFLALIVLYGGVHFLRTLSWRACLREEGKRLPLGSALSLWVAGESVAYLSFGWSGEAFRAAATREVVPVERCLSALLVSRIFYIYASLILTTVSFFLSLFLLPLAGAARGVVAATALLMGAAVLFPLSGGARAIRLLRPVEAALARRKSSPLLQRLQRLVRALEDDLAAVFSQQKSTLVQLLGLNLLATLAGVLEVFLVLRALSVPTGPAAALLIEGMSKVLSIFTYWVPGTVGVREGGVVLIFRLFQMSAALAVTLVLVRRARALAWAGIGSLLVFLHGLRPLLQAPPTPEVSSKDNLV